MTDHHQAACEAATLALAEARDRGEVGAHALARAAVDAAAPHLAAEAAAAERARIRDALWRGYTRLDDETQADLAALFARWAAAISDDPQLHAEIAALLDNPEGTDHA